MANKSLGTRQKLMFRGTAGVVSRAGTRFTGGRPPSPPPPPGAPGGAGRQPGSVWVGKGSEVGGVDGRRAGGGGAVDPHTGSKQRRTKTEGT